MPSGTLLIGIIVIAVAVWGAGSWLVLRGIEQPKYVVEEVRDGYEIRTYEPYIVAETVVSTANESQALNAGFRLIADYIFGNNVGQQKISMTSPVTSAELQSEKISMTAPVISSETATGTRKVAFIMPSKYTLETLPKPNNDAVVLREVGAHTVAAKTFSWYASNDRIETKKGQLRAALQQDGITVSSDITYAGYNPPLSAPFVQRHEILIDIVYEK